MLPCNPCNRSGTSCSGGPAAPWLRRRRPRESEQPGTAALAGGPSFSPQTLPCIDFLSQRRCSARPLDPTRRASLGRPRRWRGNAFGTRAAARQSPPGLGSALCFPPPPLRKIKSAFQRCHRPSKHRRARPSASGEGCPLLSPAGPHARESPSPMPPAPAPLVPAGERVPDGFHQASREVCVDRAGKRGWDSGWRSAALAGALPAALEAAGFYPARYPPGI